MVTANSLERRFKEVFSYAMAEQISDDDNVDDLEQALAQLRLHYTFEEDGVLSSSHLFGLEVDEFEDYMFENLSDVVSFDNVRFQAWAREAAKFCNSNAKHESFEPLFTNGLQYEAAVKSFLQFDYKTDGLKKFLSQYPNVVNVDISQTYPFDTQVQIAYFAERAVGATLAYLAQELANVSNRSRRNDIVKIEQIKRQPSFKNKRGVIAFGLVNERLTIANASTNSKASSYKPLLDRSLKNLERRNTLQRIHNTDPFIEQLISEYRSEIEKPDEIKIAKLWLIGQELESQLRLHQEQGALEDVLDKTDLLLLSSFLTSHNLYLQCFDITATLLSDLHRSLFSYQRVRQQSRGIPWALLADLGSSQSIMEASSAEIVRKASTGLQEGHETKGLLAIGLGLLRGAMQQIGGLLMELSVRVLEKTTEEIGREGLLNALNEMGAYQPMLHFIQSHVATLLELSASLPHYFGWIRAFLTSLGLS